MIQLKDKVMTNEEKAQEIIGGGCNRQDCYECGGSLSVAEGCVEFRHLKEMAEWKDSEYSWQEIPKDKHGFYDDLKKNLYDELPIIVCCDYDDGMYPVLEYIDKDNWYDAVSDLSKPNYHYYMKVQPLKESKL